MAYQATFKRYELKYLLTRQEKQNVLKSMAEHMKLDDYGRTTIRNIYFDTDTYRLIRHSLEKPVYKEKLRLRSYGTADKDTTVFVELKKKYESVVYKRRIAMSEAETERYLSGHEKVKDTQITREIDYCQKIRFTKHHFPNMPQHTARLMKEA